MSPSGIFGIFKYFFFHNLQFQNDNGVACSRQ